MTVSVVIVNYRTAELTKDAVLSALAEPEATEVIVVDNASRDGSLEDLVRTFASEGRVQFVSAHENVGFGRANNRGVARATQPYVFLLNSDATFIQGCLGVLIAHWSALPTPGVLAPAVYRGESDELQRDAQGVFPTVWRMMTLATKRHEHSLAPDWVSGCAMLLRRDDFLEVGGFDDDFFMYFEDVLLCWRLRQTGRLAYRCVDGGVRHVGSASSPGIRRRTGDYDDAQDLLLRKLRQPIWGQWLVKVLRLPYRWSSRTFARG